MPRETKLIFFMLDSCGNTVAEKQQEE